MASPVDISNAALAHIGAENQVTSIDPPDGSVEAGYCARFYPMARRTALECYNWAFARTRVALAQVDNPSTVWQYAYQVPNGCLTARRVLPLQTISAAGLYFMGVPNSFDSPFYNWSLIDALFDERGSTDFEIEGDTLLTNEPDAVLLYTRDITDSSKFTPMFTSAVGMLLAGYLAGPIIKGREGMSVGTGWTQSGMNMLGNAINTDANASNESAEYMPASLRARQ